MTTTVIKLPVRPHENQHPLIRSTARFNVIAAGRRFGKTEACKIRAIYRAMDRHVWWVTPTYAAGTDTWRDFVATFQHIPSADINKAERRIELPTGGLLKMVAADSFKRGAGPDHIFIDEAAFCSNTLWEYELRPMLMESKGHADILSSTNGRNWFWDVYRRGLDPQQPQWCSWHYTCYDNPLLDREEIEDIRRNTPERVFRQEYLAEFLEDGGAVIRNISACLIQEPQRNAVGKVVFGVDLGRHNDYTVIIAMDSDTKRVLEIDRFTEIGWELQLGRIKAMADRWHPTQILMEENFNDSFVERAHAERLPVHAFRTTNASKQQVINALALAFEQAAIGIPDDPVLISELQAYTMERLPSGMFRYSAPAGGHDDTVIALALAWHALNVGAGFFFME